MAGFVGICSKALSGSQSSIGQAVDATVYSSRTSTAHIHADHNLVVRKSFMSFIESGRMEASRETVCVWIDGEVYNYHELEHQANEVFADTVLKHYLNDTLENLLKKVDGIFIGLIYDPRKQQLHIITDRYGLKIFYLCAKNNCLLFAPELKCFPFFTPFKTQIRKDVIDCFVELEHMVGTATWFDGVEVTEPSAIYTYSWETSSLVKKRYWSWSLIRRSSMSLKSAIEGLAEILDNAVKARKFGDYRVGVGLSGGFDSRAILAAIHDDKPVTYTFGIPESADVHIARKVARVAGVENIHFDVRVDHWLKRRFIGIWKTDGMLNMYHMHYSHLMDDIAKIMEVNLSGFLGDCMLGNTYLIKKGKTFFNKRIDEATAHHYYGKHYIFSDPNDSFFDIDKVDAYLFYNRGRRLIGLGMEEANKTIFQRLPFMDVKLLEFSYSWPDEFRAANSAYHGALLMKYPEFYRTIPHATSGVPANINPNLFYKTRKFYHRWLWVLKYKLGVATSFTDVYNWVKQPETARFISETLDRKTAIYSNFSDLDPLKDYFEPHMKGKGNHVKRIMSAVTMEIWFQQVFNKKYRSYELPIS